jgi:hypothetical protein
MIANTENKLIILTEMKTLAQITLTALVMIMISNFTQANNYRKFRMQISQEKEIYVFSKLENIVEEFIPYAPAVSRHIVPEIKIHMIQEELVEEDMTFEVEKRKAITDEEVMDVVRSMQTEEKEVAEDLGFDTHEIFEEYQHAHAFELTPEILAKFVVAEKEVVEDTYFLALINKTKAK